MDVISQAVFGASLSQSFAKDKVKQVSALVIGALAGMLPDLDVFIRSSSDPLLFLEFHRQFTHSLFFIPFGALVSALVFFIFIKHKLTFKQVYLFSFLGFATHGLLDVCTSYGTQLFWPFSTQRVSWNLVSIVDPLFTIPIIIGIVFAVYKNNRVFAQIAFVYAIIFLSLGLIQKQRAENALHVLIQQRGHQAERTLVKPSFGNRHVWKIIYEYNGRYYVDAVKLLSKTEYITGTSIQKLKLKRDFPWLAKNSLQAKDVERFRKFSGDFLALNPEDSNSILDIRYSLLPNEIKLMWGITLSQEKGQNRPDTHVNFVTDAKLDKETREKFIGMLF